VSLRSKVTRAAGTIEILMGGVDEEVNPYSGRVMHRRTAVSTPERMADETTFASTDAERVPSAYIVPATLKGALDLLRAHGVVLEPIAATATLPLEAFDIAASTTTPKPFENHQERTATGAWGPVEREVPAGAYRVAMTQRLARMAFYLLEPRTNDGLLTWNVVDDAITDGTYPILRTRD
jgi:hypothetical protein